MHARSAAVRLLAGLALALALAAAIVPFAGQRAMAQENGEASITLYTVICPLGTDEADDLFALCYDEPAPNITFDLELPDGSTFLHATTGDDGFTAFEGLTDEGVYTLHGGVPGHDTDVVLRCSEDGAAFPVAPGDSPEFFELDLSTDNDIRCDFYILPISGRGEEASITIYKAICPAGYAGDDFFADCFDNPGVGVQFFLNVGGEGALDATTGADGFAAFENLGGGTVILGENTYDDIFVLCSSGGENFPFTYVLDSAIELDLTPDDDIRCDWYDIPAATGGETPTTAPTQAAQPTPTISTLPSTGAGDVGGSSGLFLPLAGALALVGFAAVGFAASRTRLAHRQVGRRR